MNWETVIGLEIHAQLKTKSKIFSGASTAFGGEPNAQACAIDLGLPGVLPVLNEEAVRLAVTFGLAINATIAPRSVFARKNYFYPDLPKGYQISQFELPIVQGGYVDITVGEQAKRIAVTRAHLEEDAGKSLHDLHADATAIDLNRAGTPLIEIVSEPELRSADEAVAYMKTIHSIVRYLDVCDGNMQEGSFRCDANVSLRRLGETKLGTRTELKNLNSFRFVERAIDIEVERQAEILEAGQEVTQETRLYDPSTDETHSMRSKEEANDYRYFPDPDLLPLELSPAYIEQIRSALPELPDAKRERFIVEYTLESSAARALTASRELAQYFEDAVQASGGEATLAQNWITGELAGALNKESRSIEASPVSPQRLAGMLRRIADGTLSATLAKQVFDALWRDEGDADDIIRAKGLEQVTDSAALESLIAEVLSKHPAQVEQYRAGKQKVFGFFVGQTMKASKGKANPAKVNEILKRLL